VHLVGFIIRIYHDARSPGRQINHCTYCFSRTENERAIIHRSSTGELWVDVANSVPRSPTSPHSTGEGQGHTVGHVYPQVTCL